MKILHCLNSPRIGGLERLVVNLVIAQKKRGLNVAIMLDSRKGEYLNDLVDNGLYIIDSGVKGGFDFRFNIYKRLKKDFKNFDLIHFHSFSPVKLFAAQKFPHVYTIHGLSKGVRKENYIKYHSREALKKKLLNNVSCFIANSQYTLNCSRNHYGLGNVYKVVVLNGSKIEIKNNLVRKEECAPSFKIGMVSRFTRRKRIDRLINSFEKFLNMNGKGILYLVGDGSEADNIRQMIKAKCLEKYITMPGYITEVNSYYQEFDICVHPSDNEGFGLVGVEAYSNGKPILAFEDSGGLREVIEPFEPEDILKSEQAMAERMLFYYNNHKKIEQSALERRRYAIENFSLERMERDYFEVYNNILGL
ncbi:glycosyltransferase [Pontixanthobacter gangjinensis]|uniref:Glycosyltransferase family 4 protein n=1 Tax=Christiangramia aestuarii TaxID=1028746 RepID=A0A7K1LN11_9FLAO|nr:glycosyltransferase family 4 protein [Christiangramia aestuarii]MUP42195.1 glycosyltransferase family 4 protein [Christiangramia aestuarii]